MIANAASFAAYIVRQAAENGTTKGFANSFQYFLDNSKTGGAWDLKNQDE